MKVILKQKKKNPTIETIEHIHTSITAMANHRTAYADSLSTFSSNLLLMTEVVCPEYESAMKEVKDIYGKIVMANFKFAQSEKRVAEDIRDLVERFNAVNRVNNSYMNQRDAYEKASNNLISALAEELAEKDKPGYEKIRFKIEQAIAKAKAEKNAQNKLLKDRILDLVEAKKKYNIFKARRLTSAWKLFTESLAAHSQTEADLFRQLCESLDRLKEGRAPPEIIAAIQESAKPVGTEAEQAASEQVQAIAEAAAADPETTPEAEHETTAEEEKPAVDEEKPVTSEVKSEPEPEPAPVEEPAAAEEPAAENPAEEEKPAEETPQE